ncbi:hypothetical protein IGI65_000038 [Enterococcus sp. DIV0755b]
MRIRRNLNVKVGEKRWLAALHKEPLYRTRQIQAICYASLLLNVLMIICWVFVYLAGR